MTFSQAVTVSKGACNYSGKARDKWLPRISEAAWSRYTRLQKNKIIIGLMTLFS